MNKRRFRKTLAQNAIYYKVKRVITLSGDTTNIVRFGAAFNGHILPGGTTDNHTALWIAQEPTPTVATSVSVGDVPDLSAQYDQMRIAGIGLKWYPGMPNGSVSAAYAPMAIVYDRDGIEGNVMTVDVPTLMEQTNGVSVKNAYRPWKKYFKAPKQRINTRIPSETGAADATLGGYRPNTNLAGQWVSTNQSQSTWSAFASTAMNNPRERGTHLLVATETPNFDVQEPAQLVGTLVVTTYLVYKDRR